MFFFDSIWIERENPLNSILIILPEFVGVCLNFHYPVLNV